MSNKDHLNWIYLRLLNVHKEKENIDYMLRLKAIIDAMPNQA